MQIPLDDNQLYNINDTFLIKSSLHKTFHEMRHSDRLPPDRQSQDLSPTELHVREPTARPRTVHSPNSSSLEPFTERSGTDGPGLSGPEAKGTWKPVLD